MTLGESHSEFVLESREHLIRFESSLLALEQAESASESIRLVNESFRAIHSLKGDAGFLGFSNIRDLAHAMENVLDAHRQDGTVPTANDTEVLLAARDRIAILVDDLANSGSLEVGPWVERLTATIASKESQGAEYSIDLAAAAQTSGGLIAFFKRLADVGAIQRSALREFGSLAGGLHSHPKLTVRFSSPFPEETLRLVFPQFTEAGEIGRGARGTKNLDEFAFELDLQNYEQAPGLVPLFRRLDSLGIRSPEFGFLGDLETGIRGPITFSGVTLGVRSDEELLDKLGISRIETKGTPVTAPAPAPIGAMAERDIETPAHTPSLPTRPPESERLSSLRINVELLDRLMNLVGELTLVRNQSLLEFAKDEGANRAIVQRLNAVTSKLQETVLLTRMQPVGNLFGRFPRMVRDLSRQLQKQVEVVTIGSEVELDKTVLEQLSDPLTHLIRNSIDHGIETPDVRLAKGKPAGGKITLTATPADGQVHIEIRDDGKGIQPSAVREKALALKLKTEAELDRMSSKDLFSLILLPGFSTAKQVTDVSGRGVGMDVVKTNVEQLEGSLSIDSTPDVGSSIMLRVPLTMAIIPCLIVIVKGERFAVPQRELEEIVCIHPGAKGTIEHSFDTEMYRLRDRLLPIVRFSEVLARSQAFTPEIKAEILRKHDPDLRDPKKVEYILVLRTRGRRFGLLVDEVRGTEEIVVKPMHTAMKRIGIFAGATLMGDGRVALIANVDGIAEHANCLGAEPRASAASSTRDPSEVHRVLLFAYGPAEQFALPLLQIRRIELLDMSKVERIGNQEFVSIENVATRIVRMDQVLDVSRCESANTMYLILPKFVSEPMGILVSRIVDTESLAIDLQRATVSDPGVLGTATLRGRLSLFLDIQYIRQRTFGVADENDARPLSIPEADEASSVRGRRILLVDDTPFFREIVKRYFEADGMDVTTAANGEEGLDLLTKRDFDLVVSDIEMPVLDGWGFCKRARERGITTPFLALTSLSHAEHLERANQVGFDEFEEKLDHDRLLRKVKRLLAKKTSYKRTGQLEEAST